MKVIEYEKKIVEGIYNNLELDGVLKLDYSGLLRYTYDVHKFS